MTRPSTPLVSRKFAIFLIALASVVMSTPFIERKDWQGWVAFFVVMAAIGTMLTLWLRQFVENVLDWWNDDRESPF